MKLIGSLIIMIGVLSCANAESSIDETLKFLNFSLNKVNIARDSSPTSYTCKDGKQKYNPHYAFEVNRYMFNINIQNDLIIEERESHVNLTKNYISKNDKREVKENLFKNNIKQIQYDFNKLNIVSNYEKVTIIPKKISKIRIRKNDKECSHFNQSYTLFIDCKNDKECITYNISAIGEYKSSYHSIVFYELEKAKKNKHALQNLLNKLELKTNKIENQF